MNPQLTITILAVLLLVNSVATLVYWFRLREANETIKANALRSKAELTRTGEFWLEKTAELQSKLNAARDALK